MTTLILVRHGRSTANTEGVLAGWMPGVALDERGREQAAALPERLAGLPLVAAVASPLQRCEETLAPLLAARPGLPLHSEERIGECHYGDWTGRKLKELSGEPLMDVVQNHPSAAAFPGGESLRAMAARSAEAVREWNARLTEEHGEQAMYVMCSHGDIIKSLVADALGLHLDQFQRIHVDPCSVTVIHYTRLRPFLVRLGDTGDLAGLAPRTEGGEQGQAAVGGGAGAA
ncbi:MULTISPECIES: histidine phosphatase family protein [Streptomyces]|uniref:Histidine phosphatase family protein n=1 Tax=Streptomyces evansiae TaxID=3075535 RepID=A0ABU2QUJ6_9ACTN|nr:MULTISPECIES: histidine phosphatase family protein [unclassified Streptomyces]MDT0408025.1 histidine phosphatase family protein [Streptomyces sp. DSM 41979]MYQ56566.1 MSMEG_4193 family putative phosphomutase [Streptomyces sp. SID4926]SCE47962.1 probable phosphomutase, MSMEG_4193 family [Streptomyces sp. DfronAA-171]